jgi:hypothetical protein
MSAIRRIAVCAVLLTALTLSLHAEDTKSAWTPYRNQKWQFCAAFRGDWRAEEVFDGEVLKTTPKGSGDDGAIITLGAFRNQHGEGEGPAKPLEAIAEDAEDDLRDSMVRNLQATNQSATVSGLNSLITRQSYLRGDEPFLAKEVRVRRDDSVVVELVLRAPDAQFAVLEPEFDRMVQNQFAPMCTKLGK